MMERAFPRHPLDRRAAFLRAIDEAYHLADDKFFPPLKPGEVRRAQSLDRPGRKSWGTMTLLSSTPFSSISGETSG